MKLLIKVKLTHLDLMHQIYSKNGLKNLEKFKKEKFENFKKNISHILNYLLIPINQLEI